MFAFKFVAAVLMSMNLMFTASGGVGGYVTRNLPNNMHNAQPLNVGGDLVIFGEYGNNKVYHWNENTQIWDNIGEIPNDITLRDHSVVYWKPLNAKQHWIVSSGDNHILKILYDCNDHKIIKFDTTMMKIKNDIKSYGYPTAIYENRFLMQPTTATTFNFYDLERNQKTNVKDYILPFSIQWGAMHVALNL